MPLIKIDSSYFKVHPELSKRIEILSRISQSNGKLKSYTEDYPQLETLLLAGNHNDQKIGGYISLGASLLNGEETIAEMEVVVAFDAADNTLLLINDGDYVIGKCPPNDQPMEDEEGAPATVLVLETKQALLDHLNIEE